MTQTTKTFTVLGTILGLACLGLSILKMQGALLVCLTLLFVLGLCGWSARVLYSAVFIGLTAFLVNKQNQGFVDDPGVGWHLETGRLIASTHAIPHHDPFLSSHVPRPWICDQWLADLMSFIVYDFGGWSLVYGCGLITFLVMYLVCLPSMLTRSGVSGRIAIVVSVISLMLGLPHFLWRPVLFGNLFFTLTFIFVYTAYQLASDRSNTRAVGDFLRRYAFTMPLLFIAWANSHPSFGMGLLLIAMLGFALALDKVVLKREVATRSIVTIGALFLLCLLATLINPYGINLHLSIAALFKSDFFMSYHQEWQPMRHRMLEGELFEGIFMLFAVTILLAPARFKTLGFFSIISVLFFAHGSLQHARMVSYFSITIAPLLAQTLTALWRYLGERIEVPKVPDQSLLSIGADAAVLLLIAAGPLLFIRFAGDPLGQYVWPNVGISQRYPYAALDAIRNENPKAIVYANPDLGGFITHQGEGKIKAVIDDRNTMLGEQMYREYILVNRGDSQTSDIVKRSGATHLLIRRGEPTEALFVYRPDLITYQDALALVVRVAEMP